MISKGFGGKYFVRIDKGEEIIQSLKIFCEKNSITSGSITGIGAVSKATIGFFDTKTKQYHQKELKEGYEIANLVGNISIMDNEIYFHIHATLSDADCNAFGGHLNSAVVSGTCEIIIDAISGEMGRKHDKGIGLNLLSAEDSKESNR